MMNLQREQIETLLDAERLQVLVWGMGRHPRWYDVTRAGKTFVPSRKKHEYHIPCRVGINGGTAAITAKSKWTFRRKPRE